MAAIVEISVRLFFTSSDGVDVAPQVSIPFPVENLGEVNWSSVLGDLVEKCREAIAGAPVEGLRPMTQDETTEFREAERD